MPKNTPKTISPWLDTVPEARRYAPLTGEAQADVAIIGGGIEGVTAAWLLAKKGIRTVLLEKNNIGRCDSSATTGFLTRVPDASAYMLAHTYTPALVKNIFA